MSTGPVYCPNDGTELHYDFSGTSIYESITQHGDNESAYMCAACGLRWDGHFPVSNNKPRRLQVIPGEQSPEREMTPEEIMDDLFTYHPPTPEQVGKYQRINDAAKAFALVIHKECPMSPDRTAAIRLVREARMTANSSIATKSGGLYR